MILVIAEKPSVAADLARVIGARTREEGSYTGNGYRVSWAIGHLVGLSDPGEVNSEWEHWRADALPMLPDTIPLKVLPKTKKQFTLLKKLMNSKDTERIICATDAGREGELIFRYIYQMAGCKKPFSRLWISSMTDEAIRKGFQDIQEGSAYNRLYESARCRSEADWLIGMNASRAFTLRYNALLSVGRVQTPTLQILVKRRLEIDHFKPEPYHTVRADFSDYHGMWFDKTKEGFDTHIPNLEDAQRIAALVKGKQAVVSSVQTEKKTELPPLLYDLTSLQRDASSRYGFPAAKTLQLAQNLYEKHKLLTYPRTDSRFLPVDAYGSAQKALQNLPDSYADFTAPLLQKPLSKSKRIFDNSKISDHHAIIPTGRKADPDKLVPDEQKIFDMVARRLIAVFMEPYIYLATRVITHCEDQPFVSNGKQVLQPGWRALNDSDIANLHSKAEEEQQLPPLQKGETRPVTGVKLKSDMTKPPKEHTDATLLAAMEHVGRTFEDEELAQAMKGCSLGTPATRATIIERLIEVGYVRRKGKQLMATSKGVALIEVAPDDLTSPETTGRWELELERIAQGQGDSVRFMDGIRRLTAHLTQYAANQAPDGHIAPEEVRGKGKSTGRRKASNMRTTAVSCPVCGRGQITENSRAFGCSRWRDGCSFTVWKDGVQRLGGPEITEHLLTLLLNAADHTLKGSTGTLMWQDGKLGFLKKPDTLYRQARRRCNEGECQANNAAQAGSL